jgi:ParB family chromosome partitioning protein
MGRRDLFLYLPEQLTIVTDKEHPLYDERVNLALNEHLVKNIMIWGPREPVEARKNGVTKAGVPIIEVIDGRQRTRATAEANKRLIAQGDEPWQLKVILSNDVKDDGDLLGLQILHNELREDDPPSTKAQKCMRLLEKGKKIAEAANIFGVTEQTIHFWKNLMLCSSKVLKAVDSGELPAVVAVKLAKLPREDQDVQLDKMREEGNLRGKAALEAATAVADAATGKTPKPKKAKAKAEEEDEGEEAGPRMRRRPKIEEMLARFSAKGVNVADLPNGRLVLRWVLGEDTLPKAWVEDAAE